MKYLAVEPEVPADLLQKILARTSGGPSREWRPRHSLPARPAWHRVVLPAVRQVVGAKVDDDRRHGVLFHRPDPEPGRCQGNRTPRMQDFQPSRLRANITRQYYSTNEQVTKYYKNLRLVYEMESRVRELRRTTDTEPAPSPSKPPSGRHATAAAVPARRFPRGSKFPPRRTTVRASPDAIPRLLKWCQPGLSRVKEKRKISERSFQGFAFYN